MKKMLISIIVLVVFVLVACGSNQQENANSCEQYAETFGVQLAENSIIIPRPAVAPIVHYTDSQWWEENTSSFVELHQPTFDVELVGFNKHMLVATTHLALPMEGNPEVIWDIYVVAIGNNLGTVIVNQEGILTHISGITFVEIEEGAYSVLFYGDLSTYYSIRPAFGGGISGIIII